MTIIPQIALLITTLVSDRSIQEYTQPNLRDISVEARVVQVDQRELKKIKKDYGQDYKFDRSTIRFKEPFKLRVDSTVEDTTVSLTYNGKFLKISAPGISKREDLSQQTLRRETVMDFGLLVPSLFPDFFTAKFVRMDRETGDAVFDITYTDPDEQARYRIWIDPVRHYITKREWYNRYKTQLATFYYDHPVEVSGIWIPTMVTVKNMENKIGGSTKYESVHVNTGLSDSIFSVGR